MTTDTKYWETELPKQAEAAAVAFKDLVNTIGKLRHPIDGCPWDLKQTHQSLAKYLIEESYETIAAISQKNLEDLGEELGDVLLQVVLHAQLMAEYNSKDDQTAPTIIDVVRKLNEKMIRRHPHVFKKGCDPTNLSADDVTKRWQDIKQQEKQQSGQKDILSELANLGMPPQHKAIKIGKLTQKENFDWESPAAVVATLKSEVAELEQALQENQQAQFEEIGDVFFTLSQLCRHLKCDPDLTAEQANQKFIGRYRAMYLQAATQNKTFAEIDPEEKEEMWRLAKKNQTLP